VRAEPRAPAPRPGHGCPRNVITPFHRRGEALSMFIAPRILKAPPGCCGSHLRKAAGPPAPRHRARACGGRRDRRGVRRGWHRGRQSAYV
jgi:hypothetical protein